jgi:hypothetical protein
MFFLPMGFCLFFIWTIIQMKVIQFQGEEAKQWHYFVTLLVGLCLLDKASKYTARKSVEVIRVIHFNSVLIYLHANLRANYKEKTSKEKKQTHTHTKYKKKAIYIIIIIIISITQIKVITEKWEK